MEKNHCSPITILCAEDDPDDRFLVQDAFREGNLVAELHFVEDGDEALDYLHRRERYKALAGHPLPSLILMDLNMPKKDGREVIREIKRTPDLMRIPVVVLTTSRADDDLRMCYDLGANSFIIKPVQFDTLVDVVKSLQSYWFGTVNVAPELG